VGAPSGKNPGKTRGITGKVYSVIQVITRVSGASADAVLALLQGVFESADSQIPRTPREESFLSALNGVMGDHLVDEQSPFALSMTLQYQDSVLDGLAPVTTPANASRVLLLIHGLCMNDLKLHARQRNHSDELGAVLSSEMGFQPVYVRYNSGLHVSQNGRELSAQLEKLLSIWPQPIEELSVVAHSMGGLLIRSALHQALEQGLSWPRVLRKVVFLGTPHHGAPLERAGNWVDVILDGVSFTRPFAALGQLRSAGITDLRHGNLLDEDWQPHERFDRKPDQRRVVPLPETVNWFAVAATLAEKRNIMSDRLVGDGLVPLRSALGQHDDESRTLHFKPSSQWIAYRTSHMGLLHSPAVKEKILHWLS
jgi:pimeloyl-ACP methyl ester carboxylesterase